MKGHAMPSNTNGVRIGGNEYVEYEIVNESRNRRLAERAKSLQVPDPRGSLALEFMRAWGMVAGHRGKDTSTGHPTLELMDPEAVVQRACDMAEMAYAQLKSRGWM